MGSRLSYRPDLIRSPTGGIEQRFTATAVEVGEPLESLAFGDEVAIAGKTFPRHCLILRLEDDGLVGELNEPYNEGYVTAVELEPTRLRVSFGSAGPQCGRIAFAGDADVFEDAATDKQLVDEEWMEYGDISLEAIEVRFTVDAAEHQRITTWLTEAARECGASMEGTEVGRFTAELRRMDAPTRPARDDEDDAADEDDEDEDVGGQTGDATTAEVFVTLDADVLDGYCYGQSWARNLSAAAKERILTVLQALYAKTIDVPAWIKIRWRITPEHRFAGPAIGDVMCSSENERKRVHELLEAALTQAGEQLRFGDQAETVMATLRSAATATRR